jgi:DNA polymerase-3 subunit beta
MHFGLTREDFLYPLQLINSVVERRQTLPILSHMLVEAAEDRLRLHATDLEVAIDLSLTLQDAEAGRCTLPARKCLDILRALPEGATVELSLEAGKASLRSGSTRFTLAVLSVQDFPYTEEACEGLVVSLPQGEVRAALERTHFAMAQQDVRYYLNGMLWEVSSDRLRAVATDGHRLALCDVGIQLPLEEPFQSIIPRKAVLELLRLLDSPEETVEVCIGAHQARFAMQDVIFRSKLVDGRFPDYGRVIPAHNDKRVRLSGQSLRAALLRVAILTSDQFRTVRLRFAPGRLAMSAHNLEQEEAQEELEIGYEGEEMEISFNAGYLLDVLGALGDDEVILELLDASSGCLIRGSGAPSCQFVVMPMQM